jgi:hypothetical protein
MLISQGLLLDNRISLLIILSNMGLGELCFNGMTLFCPLAKYVAAPLNKAARPLIG